MLVIPDIISSLPVLTMMPNAIDGREVQLVRGDASDVFGGATDVDTEEAIQNVQRSFQFLCSNRAEIAELRAFFRARKGRKEPFFYPTWRWEFTLCGYKEPNAGEFLIWITHSRFLTVFTRNPKLRWFVISRGAGYQTLKITDASEITENIVPGIDRVHLSQAGNLAPFPPYFDEIHPNETYRIYSMRCGRFDTDKLEFVYEGEDMATATLPLVETTDEAP